MLAAEVFSGSIYECILGRRIGKYANLCILPVRCSMFVCVVRIDQHAQFSRVKFIPVSGENNILTTQKYFINCGK